jgi:hypothetical protein
MKLFVGFCFLTLVLAGNAYSLTQQELKIVEDSVVKMCLFPDRKSSFIKVEGNAKAGLPISIKIVKGELSGKIAYETWNGMPIALDKYKTDPRKCAQEIFKILLPAFETKARTGTRKKNIKPKPIEFKLKSVETTGDEVIDKTLARLSLSTSSTVVSEYELTEVLATLFTRPAFYDIREENWKYFLFVLCKTRLILEDNIHYYKSSPDVRADLYKAIRIMVQLQNDMKQIYGPTFSPTEHIRLYINNRDAFINKLRIISKPDNKFFEERNNTIKELRNILCPIGLIDVCIDFSKDNLNAGRGGNKETATNNSGTNLMQSTLRSERDGLNVKVLLREFFDNNSNGWTIGENKEYGVIIKDGEYIMSTNNDKGSVSMMPSSLKKPRNFDVELSTVWKAGTKNSAYGLVLGTDSKNCYVFGVSGNGKATVVMLKDGNGRPPLIPWRDSCAREGDGLTFNKIKVEVRGDQMSLLVNDISIGTIENTIMVDKFMVGVGVDNKQSVAFDNLTITEQL